MKNFNIAELQRSEKELHLFNEITIYEDFKIQKKLVTVANIYSDIWHDTDYTVNIVKTKYL